MGGLTGALPGERAGTHAPTPNLPTTRVMRILRPQSAPSPRPRAPAVPRAAGAGGARLRCRVRLADGRVFTGELPAARHRALQLGMLHADTAELVELTPRHPDRGRRAAARPARPARALPARRRRPESRAGSPPCSARRARSATAPTPTGTPHDGTREEAFVGVAPRLRAARQQGRGRRTRFLWVDIDQPGQLPALWAFLAERPCHLLIESGGSGGVHAYWKLAEPLPAPDRTRTPASSWSRSSRRTCGSSTASESATTASRTSPTSACKERARVMRLAGTSTTRPDGTRGSSRPTSSCPATRSIELVGDLPDPAPPAAPVRAGRAAEHDDPYKRIPPPEYFQRLAGITVPRSGLVSCPVPGHDDAHPSCSVGVDSSQGWCCHAGSCGARGAIYDLASVADRRPVGTRAARRGVRARTRARARNLREPAMTTSAAGTDAHEPAADGDALYVVDAVDVTNEAIAGHPGCAYRSPPQVVEDALALVRLLLGGPVTEPHAPRRWTRPIAGGQRTVTLTRADPAP